MDQTHKMLQAIINGQAALKQELINKIDMLGEKLEKRIVAVEKNLIYLTTRIDKIGKQVAFLEDDAPTREEFDNLEDRVGKLERKPTSSL